MTTVRNRTLPITDYDGRPTEASNTECPCRSCYHPHNFTKDSYNYFRNPVMMCLTRENGGCPKPQPASVHIYTSSYGLVCKRCGYYRTRQEAKLL